jgi:SAM-dependent methyltransferase
MEEKSSTTYDSHLLRLKDRPGEALQNWLVERQASLIRKQSGTDAPLILEIGPGAGRMAKYFLSKGFSYSAVEPTSSMAAGIIAEGEILGSDVNVFRCNLGEVPTTENNKYDIVFAIHVLEHNSGPYDARNFMLRCFELLKPGGSVVIICPDFDSYGKMFYNVDWSHGYETSKPRVSSLLDDVGFKEIVVTGSRASHTNLLVKALIAPISFLFPSKLMDKIFEGILGQKMLATGFSVGFLKRNIQAVASKPLNESR